MIRTFSVTPGTYTGSPSLDEGAAEAPLECADVATTGSLPLSVAASAVADSLDSDAMTSHYALFTLSLSQLSSELVQYSVHNNTGLELVLSMHCVHEVHAHAHRVCSVPFPF